MKQNLPSPPHLRPENYETGCGSFYLSALYYLVDWGGSFLPSLELAVAVPCRAGYISRWIIEASGPFGTKQQSRRPPDLSLSLHVAHYSKAEF